MKIKSYLLVLTLVVFTINIRAQKSLEIRFQPDSSLYAYKVNSNPVEVYTAVLQNIAIVNNSEDSLELEKLTLTVVKDSLEVQKITIHKERLNAYAEKLNIVQQAGKLNFLEFKLQASSYLKGVDFAPTTKLFHNNAIVVMSVPLLFENLPDKLVVSAYVLDGKQEVIGASKELNIKEYQLANQYDFPLKGTWSAFGAPSLNSHHRWVAIQEFSYDFIRMDQQGNSHKSDGSKFEHYYAYGEPIYAIGDGKVVSILNDVEESDFLLSKDEEDDHWKKVKELQNKLMEKGFEYILGNHIVIEHPNGEYSYYMHLKTGSVKVKLGDQIKKGQEIGQLGQSGMTSQPHLHFQLSDGPEILKSRCLPIVFENIGDNRWNILYGDIIITED